MQQVTICYTIAHTPAPALMVMPSEKTAKKFSKFRLLPLFRQCAEIAGQVDDWTDVTLLEMKFRRCSFSLVGSNSPAGLSSTPIGRLFLDEVDKFAGASQKEASAYNLALNRTRTYSRKKHVITSTPTLTSGDIWREFKDGDQRYYYLPCVHCGEFEPLEWKNVRWPAKCRDDRGEWIYDAVRKSAFYQCPHCGGKISDDDKRAMLLEGEWRPTAEGLPGRRSYHLSGLYPIWAEWGQLAVEFLKKKKSVDDLRDFINSGLGLPWEDEVESAEADDILEHRSDFAAGTCPFEPLEVILSVDKQAAGFWYVVRAWGEREVSALLEYGFCETEEDLLAIAETEYLGPSGPIYVTVRVKDSGDFTEEVYEFCRRHGWQPLKGDAQGEQTYPAKFMPNDRCGRLLNVKTEFCKDAVARKLGIPHDRPGAWLLHAETGKDYAEQITSERMVEEADKWGHIKKRRKVVGPNHLYDCEVYNYAAACMKRVRYRTLAAPSQPDEENKRSFIRKPKHFKEGLR